MTKQEMFDKFVEFMARFAEYKAVAALRDGFIMTTPFTICGSLFLLIANLPIPGYPEFMAGLFGPHWTDPLNAVAGGTFNILGIIAVLAITYKYVEAEGCDAIMASILALAAFIIVMPASVAVEGGGMADNVIPKLWGGSNGVITAILISFFTSAVFCWCEKNHIGIKMPDAVPGGVARAFEALTPGVILFTAASVIYGLCHFMGATTFPELIFAVIQTMIANSLDNQKILDAGLSLLGNPDAHILTIQITDTMMKPGGCGATFGLLIASYLVARSQQMKTITRLGTVPGLFNINEPIIFGLPIVFNSLIPHGCRSCPYSSVTIESAIDYHRLQVL